MPLDLNPNRHPIRLRTVNIFIQQKYPTLKLYRHVGKPSYYWSDNDDAKTGFYLAGLEATTASGNPSSQTLGSWLKEADEIMKDFKN